MTILRFFIMYRFFKNPSDTDPLLCVFHQDTL